MKEKRKVQPAAKSDWCVANEHGFLSKLDEVWLVDDTIDDGENNDFSFKVVFRNPVVVKSFI